MGDSGALPNQLVVVRKEGSLAVKGGLAGMRVDVWPIEMNRGVEY